MNCNSPNVIYQLPCKHWLLDYIGETIIRYELKRRIDLVPKNNNMQLENGQNFGKLF